MNWIFKQSNPVFNLKRKQFGLRFTTYFPENNFVILLKTTCKKAHIMFSLNLAKLLNFSHLEAEQPKYANLNKLLILKIINKKFLWGIYLLQIFSRSYIWMILLIVRTMNSFKEDSHDASWIIWKKKSLERSLIYHTYIW